MVSDIANATHAIILFMKQCEDYAKNTNSTQITKRTIYFLKSYSFDQQSVKKATCANVITPPITDQCGQ